MMSLGISGVRNGCVQFEFDQSIEVVPDETTVLAFSCGQICALFKRVVIDGSLLGIVVLLDYIRERLFGE